MSKITERFSDRVTDYIRYRPCYPKEVIDQIQVWGELKGDSRIADVGSGTGILTKPFLDAGFNVVGVEPNLEMRQAAERILAEYRNFVSVAGTAESTTLEKNSLNLIIAGQSFHWFDNDLCRKEFRRILLPEGKVVLVWNQRKHESSSFLKDYEKLLHDFAKDYTLVNHRNVDDRAIEKFYGSSSFETKVFPNYQSFDFEGFKGRSLSSSYTPASGKPGHVEFVKKLEGIFEKHQKDGKVLFEYKTVAYCGILTPQ